MLVKGILAKAHTQVTATNGISHARETSSDYDYFTVDRRSDSNHLLTAQLLIPFTIKMKVE